MKMRIRVKADEEKLIHKAHTAQNDPVCIVKSQKMTISLGRRTLVRRGAGKQAAVPIETQTVQLFEKRKQPVSHAQPVGTQVQQAEQLKPDNVLGISFETKALKKKKKKKSLL